MLRVAQRARHARLPSATYIETPLLQLSASAAPHCRVVAQVLLALGALSRGALPHPWPALAGILGAMSCACTAFLLGRLTFGGK